MEVKSRKLRTSVNIISSFVCQVVVLICGLVVPKALLSHFGSEVYGATTSITQFLSYIALIEGGIGGVARAELYKPLANNDTNKIGIILKTVRNFFLKIGLIFLVYVLIIGVIFKDISSLEALNWTDCFFLVLVISISNIGQYFIGMTYGILLQADQKNYVIDIINIITTVLNTAMVLLLVNFDYSIVFVKLISGCVYLLRPIIYLVYVKFNYSIPKDLVRNSDEEILKDKWSGFGQHLAYFIHSNTDVFLLTIFTDLKLVAVYGVYALVTSNMQSLITSFGSGMEGYFGEMIAKKEEDKLKEVFQRYESIFSLIGIIIFSTTFIVLIPFVKLYVSDINDVNYIYPLFGFLMVLATFIYIIRLPYQNVIIAAGKFKQTNVASIGEAVINVIISVVCVLFLGLIGVAIGTCVAVIFRYMYYLVFVSKNVVKRDLSVAIKKVCYSIIPFLVLSIGGYFIVEIFEYVNYWYWCLAGFASVCGTFLLTSLFFFVFDRTGFYAFIAFVKEKVFGKSYEQCC